jgi:elongation factor 2
MELQLTPEELYQRLDSVVRDVNHVFFKFEDDVLGEIVVDPRKGNISFGSGKQGWALIMPLVAKKLVRKTKTDEAKILSRLWGNSYYDPASKRFTSSPISEVNGNLLERFVCSAVLQPLITLFQTIRNGDFATLFDKLLPAMDVTLSSKEKELQGNELLCRVMQNWFPAGDALVGMIITHLPSPIQAQKYRVDKLYTGPLDDEIASAIRNCDPEGPLTLFISKMVPTSDGSRFFAFGRVFSGTVKPKTDVYIMNADFLDPGKATAPRKKISRVVLMMGKGIENVEYVPCGNNVGISGMDGVLVKSGTISSSPNSFPITPMKFSVSPVVRQALTLTNVADLANFVKGLKKLVNSDPCLQAYTEDSGQ